MLHRDRTALRNRIANSRADLSTEANDPEAAEILERFRNSRRLRDLKRVRAWDRVREALLDPVAPEEVKAAWQQTSSAWAAVKRGGDPEIAEIWEGVFRDRLTRWLNQP